MGTVWAGCLFLGQFSDQPFLFLEGRAKPIDGKTALIGIHARELLKSADELPLIVIRSDLVDATLTARASGALRTSTSTIATAIMMPPIIRARCFARHEILPFLCYTVYHIHTPFSR